MPVKGVQMLGASEESPDNNSVISSEGLDASSHEAKNNDAAIQEQSKPKKPDLLLQVYGDYPSRFSFVQTGDGKFLLNICI